MKLALRCGLAVLCGVLLLHHTPVVANETPEVLKARQTLEAVELAQGRDSEAALRALEALIQAAIEADVDDREIAALVERAVSTSTTLRGAADPATLGLRIWRVQALTAAGSLAEASKEAQALQTALAPLDQPHLKADLAYRHGDALLRHGQLDEAAITLAEGLRQISLPTEAQLPAVKRALLEANIEVLYAGVLIDLRRQEEAAPHNQRALTLTDTLGKAAGPTRRRAYVNLAAMAGATGDVRTQLAHLDAALATLDATTAPSERADLLYNQASILAQSGDFKRALTVVDECITVERTLSPLRASSLAIVGILRGTVLQELGRNRDAGGEFEAARVALRDVLPADHAVFAVLANNLGNAWMQDGEYSKARVEHERALTLFPAAAVPERHFPRVGLATVALREGKADEAVAHFRAALEGIVSAIGADNHPAIFARTGLAAGLWAQGDLDAAFDEAQIAERARQRLIAGAAFALSERHALSYKDLLTPGTDWLIALAAASGKSEHAHQAWELTLAARGEITRTVQLRRAGARAARDPQVLPAWHAWQAANEAFAAALVAQAQSSEPSTQIDAARTAYEQAERELGRVLPRAAFALDQARPTLADLAAALPERGTLVAYMDLRWSAPTHFDRRRVDPTQARVVALQLGRDGVARVHRLGTRAAINAAADAFAVALQQPGSSYAGPGATLRARLWDPLQVEARDARVFVLAPGSLARISFAALPAADGRPLVEHGVAFHTLEHELDLRPRQPLAPAGRLVLIGAPSFDQARGGKTATTSGLRASCPALQSFRFDALPHARDEIEALSRLWRDQREQRAQVLSGADAAEGPVRAAMVGGGLLHFATHGVYFGDECRVATPDSRGLSLAPATDDDASHRFGALALSGANAVPAADAGSDGLLTAEEIGALDLSGTQWAVLSACSTGLGREVGGEGIFGLRRAFRLAGAQTVIMSLWSVDDDATSQWMRSLYRARLVDAASTIDAVARAQREMLRARREAGLDTHPFYWAAFVAAGDWR